MNFKAFTPTQQRMMRVLLDGLPHSQAELHNCLGDELQPRDGVNKQVTLLRRVLQGQGLDIICRYYRNRKGQTTWRLVRYINLVE